MTTDQGAADVELLYAGEIKETAEGRGRSVGGEARGTLEELAPGRVEANGEIDEQKGAQENGQCEAEETSDEDVEEEVINAQRARCYR